jgi:hypothetical protein
MGTAFNAILARLGAKTGVIVKRGIDTAGRRAECESVLFAVVNDGKKKQVIQAVFVLLQSKL